MQQLLGMQIFRLVVAACLGVGLAKGDWLLVAVGTTAVILGLISFARSVRDGELS